MRKAKKVARKPAAPAATKVGVEAADAPSLDAAETARAGADDEVAPRARKQQKLSEGSLALLQRCSGLAEAAGAQAEVSPPLDKVFARHTAFAQHAKASAMRGSSTLGMCVMQADGSGAREVDWLSRSVAVFRMAGQGHC